MASAQWRITVRSLIHNLMCVVTRCGCWADCGLLERFGGDDSSPYPPSSDFAQACFMSGLVYVCITASTCAFGVVDHGVLVTVGCGIQVFQPEGSSACCIVWFIVSSHPGSISYNDRLRFG